MEITKLEELKQRAIHSVMSRTLEANKATMANRTCELHSLHVAAGMDINKTAESLKHILEYKQEAAKQILHYSDTQICEQLAQIIKHADQLIQNILGIYVP